VQNDINTSSSSRLVQKLWNYCNILRDDGLSYGDYVAQLTFLLFLKMADEQSRPPFNKKSRIPEKYSWRELLKRATGLRQSGQIPFDVGHEHRHADRGEGVRERLQRDGLAGAGGAGDQAVAVGDCGKELKVGASGFCNEERRGHE